MGIQGLLPLLKEIQRPRHISEFAGQTLAVDAYVWLHKGAFGCAEDLVKGNNTTKFIDYALHRTRLLQHHRITPMIIFDGGPLPAKKGTEVDRAARRAENLEKARALEAQGRWKEARDAWTKCVDVTPEMALGLIKALKAAGVAYIVAPYEADAQLAFLEREGLVDGIITEDSDLLVFGCKNVIYKLDTNGDCTSISRAEFGKCRDTSFSGWNDTDFRRMAILAGCDYLDSIPGVGLKTAHKLMRRHKTVEKVILNLRLEGSLVPKDYVAQFCLAELVFLHQRVYDPRRECLVTLLPLPLGGVGEVEGGYIGGDMEKDIAKRVAEGRLHPETLEDLEDHYPDFHPQEGLKRLTTSSAIKPKKISTLDSFLTRNPKGKENTPPSTSAPRPVLSPRRPVFLPKPVGDLGSGATRLADISKTSVMNAEAGPSRLGTATSKVKGVYTMEEGEARASKFFTWQSLEKRKPKGVKVEEKMELKWDDGVGASGQADGGRAEDKANEQPMEDEDVEPDFPSPVCSSINSPEHGGHTRSDLTSPGRGDRLSQDPDHMTSPTTPKDLVSPDLTRKRGLSASPTPANGAAKRQRRVDAAIVGEEENILAPSTSWLQMDVEPERQGPDLKYLFTQSQSSSGSGSIGRGRKESVKTPRKREVYDDPADELDEVEEEEEVMKQEQASANLKSVVDGWKQRFGFNQTSKFAATPRHGSHRKPLAPKSLNTTPIVTPALSRSKSAKSLKPTPTTLQRSTKLGTSLLIPPDLDGFGTPKPFSKPKKASEAEMAVADLVDEVDEYDMGTPTRIAGAGRGEVMVSATQSQEAVFSEGGGSQSASQKLSRFRFNG